MAFHINDDPQTEWWKKSGQGLDAKRNFRCYYNAVGAGCNNKNCQFSHAPAGRTEYYVSSYRSAYWTPDRTKAWIDNYGTQPPADSAIQFNNNNQQWNFQQFPASPAGAIGNMQLHNNVVSNDLAGMYTNKRKKTRPYTNQDVRNKYAGQVNVQQQVNNV